MISGLVTINKPRNALRLVDTLPQTASSTVRVERARLRCSNYCLYSDSMNGASFGGRTRTVFVSDSLFELRPDAGSFGRVAIYATSSSDDNNVATARTLTADRLVYLNVARSTFFTDQAGTTGVTAILGRDPQDASAFKVQADVRIKGSTSPGSLTPRPSGATAVDARRHPPTARSPRSSPTRTATSQRRWRRTS